MEGAAIVETHVCALDLYVGYAGALAPQCDELGRRAVPHVEAHATQAVPELVRPQARHECDD